MAQAEVKIEKSKSDLLEHYKEHIKLLFDVEVSVKNLPEQAGFCSVIDGPESDQNKTVLQLSSSVSQESIQKAIVFLKAALEESPEFTIERQTFSDEVFEMVLKESQAIERQCLTALDFDFSTRELCIKGERSRVAAAKHRTRSLIMGPRSIEPASSVQYVTNYLQPQTSQSICNEMLSNRFSGVIIQDPHDSSVRDLDNNLILKENMNSLRSYNPSLSLELDAPDSFSGPDLIDRGTGVTSDRLSGTFSKAVSLMESGSVEDKRGITDNVDTEFRLKDILSDHNSTISSDEDSGGSIVDKSDPLYQTRLGFAEKLGYTEDDLDRVLKRLGLDCDENKLLQELIENSTGLANPESEVMKSISPSPGLPDFVSSEVFQGVIKKVNKSEDKGSNLRHIVIDGSNVAMNHGKNVFSCRGIKIAVDWFRHRGHKEITVFVPQWRKETSRPDTPITDQDILMELEKEDVVVFTPARRIKGRRVVCYDDRYILKLAAETNGIVVSNDNYRDLLNENQEYRTVVDERLLMYTFASDRFMPPEDPLGRHGPTLDNFLCKEPTNPPTLPPECPYGRKCTYGNKCKYQHPERGSQPHRTVTEVLKEQASIKMQERAVKGPESGDKSRRSKLKLTRTRSLAPGEPLPGEKISSLQPPAALKEPESESSRLKSPTGIAGKKADYLSEHRKKLQEALAIASAPEPGFSSTPEASAKPQEALSSFSDLTSKVPSPSHLNVPFTSSQDNQLVTGHLLLAKKLSDEGSETGFFSNDSSSNRASPAAHAGPSVASINRQESSSYGLDKFYDRRASLQDSHHTQTQQYYPITPFQRGLSNTLGAHYSNVAQHSLPQRFGFHHDSAFVSAPQFGSHCQSFPTSEKEAANNFRRIVSYSDQPSPIPMPAGLGMETGSRDQISLKPQQSCSSAHLLQSSEHPFTAGMMHQNSSSDPQLHMTGSGDVSFNVWHSTPIPPPPLSALASRGTRSYFEQTDRRTRSEVQHPGLSRSASVQHYCTQQPYGTSHGLDRQFSEVSFGSHEQEMSVPSSYIPQYEFSGIFPSHLGTHVHHPSTRTHQASPTPLNIPQGSSMPQWQHLPPSPIKRVQKPQNSFPTTQPIPVTDPRYGLYYHLCSIFAEPRVRAVMNQYPGETDPQKLVAFIMNPSL